MTQIDKVIDKINSQVVSAFSVALFDTVEEIKRQSYVGATNQLRSGWDYTNPVVYSDRITASITNDSQRVINRIAGRSPGKQPPVDPIEQWVKKKLKIPSNQARAIAFAISKKIGREGTERFKSQENFVGIDLNGNLKSDAPIKDIIKTNLINQLET